MKDIPDYFLALNKQYGLAINDQQASYHATAVVWSWYFTLPNEKQVQLSKYLPSYLLPKKQIFFHRHHRDSGSYDVDQYSVITSRLVIELQKTDQAEIIMVISGVFKALKVILDHHQKFEISKLLDKKLLEIFVNA